MGLLAPLNSLAFPGGGAAVNAAHPMAQGSRLAAVARGGNLIDLRSGKAATINGTISPVMLSGLGPTVQSLNTGGNYLSITGVNETPTSFAFGAIFQLLDTNGYFLFSGNGSSTSSLIVSLNAGGTPYVTTNGGSTNCAPVTLSANVPYFLAISKTSGSSSINSVVVNMNTGQIYSGQFATTSTFNALTNAQYFIGGNATTGNQPDASIAAIAFSVNNYLTLPQLLAWGKDPWGFWYPQDARKTLFSSLKAPPPNYAPGAADGVASVVGVGAFNSRGAGAADGSALGAGASAFNAPSAGAADGVSSALGTRITTSAAAGHADGFAAVPSLVTVSERIRIYHPVPVTGRGISITQATTVQASPTPVWTRGAVMAQAVRISASTALNSKYSVTLSQINRIADALRLAVPASISETFTVQQSQVMALGLVVLNRVGIGSTLTPTATYGVSLAQAISSSSVIQAFLGRGLAQAFTFGSTASAQYVAAASATANMAVADALANTFVLSATLSDQIEISATELLTMIFSGNLSDGIDLSALYVAPNGSTTTWCINTRTNAITEYQNWAFNSFAKMGRKYIAADANGLYELDGERDLAENIVATMRGGMLQMNESRLSGLKGVYLGMRTDSGGDFLLKIIAGDGREYVYAIAVQPNQMTTKVEIGKGLRSRYFQFELQSLGADFDLDAITFVPMTPQRRV